MKTVGLDLAADPRRTALCVVDWTAGTVVLTERPVTDEVIVAVVATAARTGIDIPLGWPRDFVEAVVAHQSGLDWPVMSLPPPADRVSLRFRATDRAVQAQGSLPLSVSTDRIGVAAMRGARLQHLLRAAGVEVDRSGVTGRVLEAYPAGALRQWGLVHRGYKGAANVASLRSLVADAVKGCGALSGAVVKCLDGCEDDDFDAFVCAVIARAATLGLTSAPGPDEMVAACEEGWIHLPTAPLAEIIRRGLGSHTC